MIHVFHGFLGSPQDFTFLEGKDILLHDLYEMKEIPSVGPEDTLIGYSMGGRLALDIASAHHFNLKKIVLINAHPGLQTEEERIRRKEFEEKIIIKLAQYSREEFISFWNSLPLFEHDTPIDVTEERFNRSGDLFKNHLLSEQKNYLPDMSSHKDKILYIVGLQDEKYMELVSEVLLPEEISVKGIPSGHRVFQKSQELLTLLKEEHIL